MDIMAVVFFYSFYNGLSRFAKERGVNRFSCCWDRHFFFPTRSKYIKSSDRIVRLIVLRQKGGNEGKSRNCTSPAKK